jgi:hypothetical protein
MHVTNSEHFLMVSRCCRCRRLMLVVVLSAASILVGPTSAGADPATRAEGLPGALWTTPLSDEGTPIPTPTGRVIAASCPGSLQPVNAPEMLSLTPAGDTAWFATRGGGNLACRYAVTDTAGNTYFNDVDAADNALIRSRNAAGDLRWSIPDNYATDSNYDQPVLGADGNVYFTGTNGATDQVIGVNETTGAVVLDRSYGYISALYAYRDGLMIVTSGSVRYLAYDGTVVSTYSTTPFVSAEGYAAYAPGGDGSVYVAGYPHPCNGGVMPQTLSVERFTPAGRAWSWSENAQPSCTFLRLAGTPDGGVVFGRDYGASSTATEFTSLDAGGAPRWTRHGPGPSSFFANNHVFSPRVDTMGNVALPYSFDVLCSTSSLQNCAQARIDFVAQATGVATRPAVPITDPPMTDAFLLDDFALDTGRMYVTRSRHSGSPSVSAYDAPGLGQDYRVGLELATIGSAVAPGGGTLPPPELEVTVANGGGGGTAGAPDPQEGVKSCGHPTGGIGSKLLAAARCTLFQTTLEVKCGAAVAGFVFIPIKALKAAKTTKGLLDLRKLRASWRPAARFYNRLSLVHYRKAAVRGFRTPAETHATFGAASKAWKLVKLLPNLRSAVSSSEFHEMALNHADVLGLKPCVQAIVAGLDG